MAKYFKDVNTLEELRRQYRDLLKKFHPDNANGSTQATQEINAEYIPCIKQLRQQDHLYISWHLHNKHCISA